MILYKTGDACPCCGQPIKLRSKADLYAFSVICELTGLNSVGRTEAALRKAESKRAELKDAARKQELQELAEILGHPGAKRIVP